jgi:outer membrane protein assembly factor BamB
MLKRISYESFLCDSVLGVASRPVCFGSDATVYACPAGRHDNALYALRPEDGRKMWGFGFGPVTAAVHPTVPVIGPDGTLYLGTADRKFYAINPDGSKAWELDTDTAGHSTAVVGEDGLIYVNTWDLKTLALNPNGIVEWEYSMSGVQSQHAAHRERGQRPGPDTSTQNCKAGFTAGVEAQPARRRRHPVRPRIHHELRAMEKAY